MKERNVIFVKTSKRRRENIGPTLPLLFLFIICAITLSLSGCSLHQSRISDSPMEVPSSFSTQNKDPGPPINKWWQQFEDDTLNALMEQAFQQSPDIIQAYERLIQSQEIFRITSASRGVAIDINGSTGRSRQSGFFRGSAQSTFGSVTFNSFSLSAAARYELDLWEKLKSASKAAHYDVLASEKDVEALLISVSAQIADLYYLAVEQRAQIELSEQTISSFTDTLERVERRYRGGLVPAIDVYQSRQNLAAARAQKPVFQSTLAVTLNALAVLTGTFPDPDLGGKAHELRDVLDYDAGLPSQLLKRRPDINAALLRLRASDERIGAAIADRFPAFTLTGSYGGTSDQLHSVLESPNIFWNILMQVAQPVIDSGRRKAEVERSEAIFRENLSFYHKTVLNAFKEVEDALARITSSKERIMMLEDTVSASESSLRIALDRYMQGLTDYLPILTEQLRHFTAKSTLLAAKRQLISDQIQLSRALGGEWTGDIMQKYLFTDHTGEMN